MTSWQRVIRNLAMAFAILLAVGIIGGILSVIGVFGFIFDGGDVTQDTKSYAITQNITDLKVEVGAADFTIINGEKFAVESNLKNLNVDERSGKLIIKEDNKFRWNNNNITLTLTIPADFVFEDADIVTGAGQLNVDTLCANSLRLNLGAGEVIIGELSANSQSKIEGGAGAITINGGVLYNLDLDMGVGELNLTSCLLGDSELNQGVGQTNLTLTGNKDDYRLDFDKGLGSISVDGQKMSNDSVYGNGQNKVDIDGGVGEIKVNFSK